MVQGAGVRHQARGRAVSLFSIVFALVALVALAGSARADAAPGAGGSQLNAWVTVEAEHLSGRTLTVVCSSDAASWTNTLTSAGFAASQASEVYGFSLIAAGGMYLSPYVCAGLRLGANAQTRATNTLQVAWSVDVLLHESTHLGRFTSNEALAEACARTELPGELHRLYRLAYHAPELQALTLAATWFRRTQPAGYQGGTCRPAL
jgi:hypothetical protein